MSAKAKTKVERAGSDDLQTPQAIRRKVDDLLGRLRSGGVVYCPVRHHSPACAWHVRRAIIDLRPSAVLIEGPSDLTSLIPLLLDGRTRTPVAAYATFADRDGRFARATGTEAAVPPIAKRDIPRFSAYYPLCDYSPELVALRAGSDVGAELRFIDLTYPQQVLAEKGRSEAITATSGDGPAGLSLQEESYLRRSQYLRRLAQRAGCRDVNDLWDRLFETGAGGDDHEGFFRRVAAYCFMARMDSPASVLEEDGTLARDRAMAAAIRKQLGIGRAKSKKGVDQLSATGVGPVVVVTGGFHTAALPYVVADSATIAPAPLDLSPDEGLTVLMRYSFDRLDALNGYAAGMPAPEYYDRIWRLLNEGHKTPFLEAAARTIVEIGRLTRDRDLPFNVSTADEIAAVEQCQRLAALRGQHNLPSREDLLDSVRGCFVKGAIDAEGTAVIAVVNHVLAGTRVGDLPASAGVPPLVMDFRCQAEELGLTVTDTVRRKLSLELYRNATHRKISRLLHKLAFLNAPFGVVTGGPDFVNGRNLDLMYEHWDYGWSPAIESALIEASVHGASVEEAAVTRLRLTAGDLEAVGRGRNTVEAVRVLVQACRMGLHAHTDQIILLIDQDVAEDPVFESVVAGLTELAMLWQSREPLEAQRLPQVPAIARTAYRRACFLARDLITCPAERVDAALQSIMALRQAAVCDGHDSAGQDHALFDPMLLVGALEAVVSAPQTPAAILGGGAGVLFAEGRLDEATLLNLAAGQLAAAAGDPAAKTGFLRGLLTTCREVAWRVPDLLRRVDSLVRGWDESEFVHALPDLRMAFASLTPRETDRVAANVATLYGLKDLGNLFQPDLSGQDVAVNLRISAATDQWLDNEGLGQWSRLERAVETQGAPTNE
jgi:hypothetical protein